jgi:hypothetical protein
VKPGMAFFVFFFPSLLVGLNNYAYICRQIANTFISMNKKEEMLGRLKESVALKKRFLADAEIRTVAYYEDFFRKNGHRIKLAK